LQNILFLSKKIKLKAKKKINFLEIICVIIE